MRQLWVLMLAACSDFSEGTSSSAPDAASVLAADASVGDAEAVADAGAPSSVNAGPSYVIFRTSTISTGNLGGPEGADARCASAAHAAGRNGSYKALIATADNSPFDPLSEGTYVNIRRQVVFATKPTAQSVRTNAILDESGNARDGVFWTGSNHADCEGWTSSSGSAVGGVGFISFAYDPIAWFAGGGDVDCSNMVALYCIETPN